MDENAIKHELGQLTETLRSSFEGKFKASEETVNKLNDKISELQAQLEGMASKANRPPEPDSKAVNSEHAKLFVDFMRKGRNADALRDYETKAMNVGTDPSGGYLVPVDASGRIVQKIFDTTPMRQIANVVSISTDTIEGAIDRNETDAGWVSETASRSTDSTTPDVGKWKIEVHELYSEPKITQKLLDDAQVDVGAWLEAKIADKMARVQNAAFVSGNGVGKPRGFTTYSTAATADSSRSWQVFEHVATGNNGDFASSAPADKLIEATVALHPGYRGGARWVMPRAVVSKIRKFKADVYGYLWQPGLQAGAPSTLLGYPVTESEDMPTLATGSLSLAFGNFNVGYQIVDRFGIRILRDALTAKGWIKFYSTLRVGGDVTNFDAIKFVKFGS